MDPMELLFALSNNETPRLRLRASLSHDGRPEFTASRVVPFLRHLSGDALSGGTCKGPLRQVLEAVYRTPGLLGCLRQAVEGGQVADASPIGWFLLTLAAQVEEVRTSAEVRQLASALAAQPGNSAKVAQKLQVVLAGAQHAGTGGAAGSTSHSRAAAAAAAAASKAHTSDTLEDLLEGPGGRHDNDAADYRSIRIAPTSDEALSSRAPYLPRAAPSHDHPAAAGSGITASASLEDNGGGLGEREAELLDRQFRLLREDFMRPLRQSLFDLGFRGRSSNSGQQQALSSAVPPVAAAAAAVGAAAGSSATAAAAAAPDPPKPVPAHLQRNVFPLLRVVGAQDSPRPCVLVAVALPPGHRAVTLSRHAERESYWTEHGKGTLPNDALVCIARRPSAAAAAALEPLVFGTIQRRDAKSMAREWKQPVFGVVFERSPGGSAGGGGSSWAGVERLVAEIGREGAVQDRQLVLVQVSTSFFSVRPVLSCLQAMPGVPLAEELVHGRAPQPTAYLPASAIREELSRIGDNGIKLHSTQREALERGLGQRVALIQGPPGTGKTFVGALLCDAIVRRSAERILVVCYTNHALDSFLESLIAKGITSIVRVGGRSKNEALANYNLFELVRSGPRVKLQGAAPRRFGTLMDSLREYQAEIQRLERLLFQSAGAPPPQREPPAERPPPRNGGGQQQQQQGPKEPPPPPPPLDLYSELRTFTLGELPDVYEEIHMSDRWYGWGGWLTGAASLEDCRKKEKGEKGGGKGGKGGKGGGGEWQEAKKKGADKRIGYDSAQRIVFERVHRNDVPPAAQQLLKAAEDGTDVAVAGGSNGAAGRGRLGLWALPLHRRLDFAAAILQSLRACWAEKLAAALTCAAAVKAEVEALHDTSALAVLSSARVIGCTTTGAAKYKDLLRDPSVDPGVVLVEEAGELLEAHTLTSLSPRTKHLIMIGDHKQLRPKVDTWELTKQHGAGFDLNVSLFERLALAGFPHTTLGVQHRMHPDISALVRPTYPALEDAERTRQHPPVRGLPKAQRVVFVDHEMPEDGEAAADEAAKKSGGQRWRAGTEHVVKSNQHEVAMVRETVRHLLRQGYAPEQLVVLTPYLGQLMELRAGLAEDTQVLLDELDLQDLRNAALPQAMADVTAISGPAAAAAAGGAAPEGAAGGGSAGKGGGNKHDSSGQQGKGGKKGKAGGAATAASSNSSSDAASAAAGVGAGAPGAGAGGSGIKGGRRGAGAGDAAAAATSGVRIATIDNYQGEEADVVIISLVRSNAGGSIGFLREPERINVLLSRARHGMILFGNSKTLRNAKSPEGRRHWGGVLGTLEARGAILPGLPACCARHGTTSLLATPTDFALLAPDGGCVRPCGQLLPCGHACRLRCHAFDPEHVAVVCEEELLERCDKGHLVTRRCGQARCDVVCRTCQEVFRIEWEERLRLAELDRKADAVRREAELRAARLRAEVEQLAARQASLEEQRAMQQQEVELRLQREQMAKELELQNELGAIEMKRWEAERVQAAKQLLARTEAEAAARKEQLLQEQERQAALAAEAEASRRQLEEAARQLKEEEAATNAELQRIANAGRRAQADAEARSARAESQAGSQASNLRTMAAWKEELVAAAEADAGTADALGALKQRIVAAAAGGAAAAANLADTFDTLFYSRPGLGAQLVAYAAAADGGSPAAASEPPAELRRGLALLQEGKTLDALKYFSALVGKDKAQAKDAAAAFATACRAKLGLPPGKASSSKQAGGGANPPLHIADHLAAALAAAQQRSASSASGIGAATSRRSADARTAGHALAFLLHPDAAHMPRVLQEEVLGLLRSAAPSLMGPVVTGEPGAGAGGSSGSSAGSAAVPEAWTLRAARSPALAKLLKLTGLRKVKQAMFDLAAAVDLDRERGHPLSSKQYNVRFLGNPGTGKTTVARMYAELLKELGVISGAEVVETSGAELAAGGTSKLQAQLKKLEGGGLLFLDEAYQLKPKSNPMGAQVLDALLPELENRRGKLVVVLAGYKKPMEELMAYNEGLPSRFVQEFTFADYSDEELFTIFNDLIANDPAVPDPAKRFKVADVKHLRIAARRLGRQRGMTGFGNARAVRNAYEQAQRRQSARVLKERGAGGAPDPLLLQRDDLLGPKHLDVSSCSALRELEAMRGLKAVKQAVSDLLGLIRTNAELEEAERPLKEVNLNRVFLGNPGTGKTTVAGLYGRILRDLGLLSKGDVEVRVPADFVGDVLGASEQKTEAILEATKGCVLVIDEAYGLYPGEGVRDPFREAVVDTIVARVQGVPGDDRCVLLLGYEDQMREMLRKANPGLARRFQLDAAWRFEDYGPEDLLAITREAAKKKGWALDEPCLLAAVEALEAQRRKPNFGNAGAVNNLLSAAVLRMEARLRKLTPAQRAAAAPVPEDFLPPRQGGDPKAIFDDLIGCKEVLAKLREWQATITACQAMGRDPLASFELNFRFVGSPGTGKTTVARRVGLLFESLGLLASSEVVCCSANDFVTGYVNQASGKTREIFAKAVGGVLFIDEAYRLNPKNGGPFMQEALDEMVQLLTEPTYMGKMVVILAGYDKEIEELMGVNPGLKSRFSQRLHFPDFSPADAAQLLALQLRKEYALELDAGAAEALPGMAEQLAAAPNWANGRDVGTWAKRAFAAYSSRRFGGGGAGGADSGAGDGEEGEEGELLTAADLRAALDGILEDKAGPPHGQTPQQQAGPYAGFQQPDSSWQQFATATATAQPPPMPRTAPPAVRAAAPRPSPVIEEVVEERTEEQQQAPPAAAQPGSGGGGGGGFGGLPPAFLTAMQDALETLGYDLSSMDVAAALAADPSLAHKLPPLLSGWEPALVLDMIRKWQEALAKQLEQEREAARRKQRPVWRCAVCGRYGCPVAPYIERYEEA
ncbi:hypothetical protein HYH02_003079 [Chlamydomonas schloesseri]|uniref:AAA+ ATPase domain-containing protein n=1 Tax=Chlamydomonas schloesseri TaxID=2026947 RepID=A0A835WSI6_9CHLO|nr:hypothetical protein HYH02_003079 [Chlamydomonas schloesseri]|eukprot:KAG2452041.1 hypothetical protein HYH02_003079 [Chlamydomonas schloesseri]